MEPVIEYVEQPFGKGQLTSDGIQWSSEVTSALNVYSTIETVTIEPPILGKIMQVELGITWAQKADGATDKAIGLVQVLDKLGAWNDAMTAVTNGTAGTTYEEKTYSGNLSLSTHAVQFPFQIRVRVKSNGTTNNAVGKVKNSSRVRVLYTSS